MDDQLRRLERQAMIGNNQDRTAWKVALDRAGLPDPELAALQAPLTHFEEVQQDFDEIWWHAKERLRFGWDWEPRGGLVKAHHKWGHRNGERGENSKRKTLRTHRNGSSRCYRLKQNQTEDKAPLSGAAQESARRRKRRFGGRSHRQWLLHGEFGPWIFEVNLDA
jgi:hypothetical protein